MKKISRTALLPYSAMEVFDLVNDVAKYPDFLPWCGEAKVVEESEGRMVASVMIAKAGIKQSFTTENTLTKPSAIDMKLLEGPFSALTGGWHFKALDEGACKISFDIEYEVSNRLLAVTLGAVFEQIASTLVQSFCDRAKQVYG